MDSCSWRWNSKQCCIDWIYQNKLNLITQTTNKNKPQIIKGHSSGVAKTWTDNTKNHPTSTHRHTLKFSKFFLLWYRKLRLLSQNHFTWTLQLDNFLKYFSVLAKVNRRIKTVTLKVSNPDSSHTSLLRYCWWSNKKIHTHPIPFPNKAKKNINMFAFQDHQRSSSTMSTLTTTWSFLTHDWRNSTFKSWTVNMMVIGDVR